MWVSPQVRGMGVGRRLLQELELFARNSQWRTVRLDTNATLNEAIGLYLRSGYREIARFNDNPYAQRWFEKTVAPCNPLLLGSQTTQ
jgi:ribosomal protein S18 acetylase RimI-like enzyme